MINKNVLARLEDFASAMNPAEEFCMGLGKRETEMGGGRGKEGGGYGAKSMTTDNRAEDLAYLLIIYAMNKLH